MIIFEVFPIGVSQYLFIKLTIMARIQLQKWSDQGHLVLNLDGEMRHEQQNAQLYVVWIDFLSYIMFTLNFISL